MDQLAAWTWTWTRHVSWRYMFLSRVLTPLACWLLDPCGARSRMFSGPPRRTCRRRTENAYQTFLFPHHFVLDAEDVDTSKSTHFVWQGTYMHFLTTQLASCCPSFCDWVQLMLLGILLQRSVVTISKSPHWWLHEVVFHLHACFARLSNFICWWS